ncbi:MAG TPA: aminopeptidase, partial [Chryseosolibacter sp.]
MPLKKAGFLMVLILSGCGNATKNETSVMKQDPHSFAIPSEAQVKHLKWKATVDFNSRTIDASATWEIQNNNRVDSIRLDTKDLVITAVT